MVILRHESDPSVLLGMYTAIAAAFDWNDLLRVPGRDFSNQSDWLEFVTACSWFYAGYYNGRFGGYACLTDLEQYSARLHFCMLPGVPALAAVRGFRQLVPVLPFALEAYIPVDKANVIRLAELLGFEHLDTGEYWHGRRRITKTATITCTRTTGCAGDAGISRCAERCRA